MKLSLRLQTIDNMINHHYENIWDCCCDHGFLGQQLLLRGAADTVHFVDNIEQILNKLQSQLEQNTRLTADSWQVQCCDAAKLNLNACKQLTLKPPLIIIAGVGGELLIELVTNLINSHQGQALEFLLCPVHHNYKVRQALINLDLGLIDECLVQENKRYYEIIHVSTHATAHSKKAIHKVGSVMWDFSKDSHRAYLRSTIRHYQRINLNKNINADTIIHDYQSLLDSA